MMFTVHGEIYGKRVFVQWDEGRLTGSSEATIDAIERRARRLEGQRVGPVEGPVTYTKHLQNGLSAITVIGDVLTDPVASGDVPVRPELPEGAVG